VTTLAVLPNGVTHLLARYDGLQARHTDASGQWAAATEVLTGDRPRSSPAVAFDAEGNGFAAWRSRDADLYEMILVSRYSNEEGKWATATRLPGSVAAEANTTNYRGAPNLAMSSQGEVMVVWVRGAAAGAQLYANRFSNGAWDNPVPISDALGGLTFQEAPGLVAVGDDFVVAWNQTVGAVVNTYTARFGSLQGWSEPDLRSDGVTSGLTRMPRLGVDEHHNLLLVWPRATETPDVYDYVQARYVNATGTWYGPGPAIESQITDDIIDMAAADFAVPGYIVGLPFAVGKGGVSALAWASRPLVANTTDWLRDPKLAVFR
jgi:hypothetical protein